MKLEVTRDVAGDLWALSRSGEASADSRTLLETFLAQDEAFAGALKATEELPRLGPPLRLSPDGERRLLDQARDRARRKLIVIGMAVGVGAVVALASLAGVLYLVLARAA